MFQVPSEVAIEFEQRMEAARVGGQERTDYRKWLRFYLDFCHKYGHPPRAVSSLSPFLAKLASKNQSPDQRQQASLAVRLFLGAPGSWGSRPQPPTPNRPAPVSPPARNSQPAADSASPSNRGSGRRPVGLHHVPQASPASGEGATPARVLPSAHGISDSERKPVGPAGGSGRGASWEREYRELEGAIKMRNYSGKTFAAYRLWVRKFQGFVRSKPPGDLGGEDVRGFLTDLAVREGVAASTQNQAFNALLFFYRHVLGRAFAQLDGVARAGSRRNLAAGNGCWLRTRLAA